MLVGRLIQEADSRLPGTVQFLSGMEGTDGGTSSFSDESANADTITFGGNAEFDNAQAKSGSTSVLFQRQVGDGQSYLSVADGGAWNPAGQDFCIEFSVRFADSVALKQELINKGQVVGSSNVGWAIYTETTSGDLTFEYSLNGSTVTTITRSFGPSVDTWYHIAVTRDGDVVRIFIGGTQIGADAAISGSLYESSYNGQISGRDAGGETGNSIDGWVDDARITIGNPRYIANFTPPAGPLSDDSPVTV